MKYCSKCKADKPLEDYWKNKTTKDGLQTWCKPCWYILTRSKLEGESREKYLRMRRNGHLVRKYGITADEYDKLVRDQGGVCSICKESPGKQSLHVDHDHSCCEGSRTCGSCVRGLLCENCNRGLGMFKDSPELLQNAIQYLA